MDSWSDPKKRINYLCVTVQYVLSRKLSTPTVTQWHEKNQRKCWNYDHENVKILGLVWQYWQTCARNRQTDRGANIVAALRRFTNTTLKKKWGRKVWRGRVKIFCRALTAFYKRSGIKNLLNWSLKVDAETRWFRNLQMSDSFISQWDRSLEVLIEKYRETLINP